MTDSTCAREDCDRAAKARGFCDTHYRAWKRANPGVAGWGTPEARFRAAAGIKGSDECWPWLKALDAHGYGMLSVNGKQMKAHRFSYELFLDPIPDGLDLDHLCRNRACVNPWHLEPVTRGENVRRGNAPGMETYRTNVCKRGHSMDDAYVNKTTGGRRCRTCALERRRAQAAEKARA